MGQNSSTKPVIEPTQNGPYRVSGLSNFKNSKGEPLETRPQMALCRCGGSANKPFCDRTHAKIGFSSQKLAGRVPDKVDNYVGQQITIHDNRGVCAHAGHCTENLPAVWRIGQEPWIDPNGSETEKIIETVKKCPSGALSYSLTGTRHKDYPGREPGITITKDGPHKVVGGVILQESDGNQPEAKEHFTLCRCGGSKNKPFCDGTHWHIKFQDEKN